MLRPLSRVTLHGMQPFSRALFKNLLPLPFASVCAVSRKYSTGVLFSAANRSLSALRKNNTLATSSRSSKPASRRFVAVATASQKPEPEQPEQDATNECAEQPDSQGDIDSGTGSGQKHYYLVYALDHDRKAPGIKFLRFYKSKRAAVDFARSLTTHYEGEPSKNRLSELEDRFYEQNFEKEMQQLREDSAAAREEASKQLEYRGARSDEYVYTIGANTIFEADVHPFLDDAADDINGACVSGLSGDGTVIGVAAVPRFSRSTAKPARSEQADARPARSPAAAAAQLPAQQSDSNKVYVVTKGSWNNTKEKLGPWFVKQQWWTTDQDKAVKFARQQLLQLPGQTFQEGLVAGLPPGITQSELDVDKQRDLWIWEAVGNWRPPGGEMESERIIVAALPNVVASPGASASQSPTKHTAAASEEQAQPVPAAEQTPPAAAAESRAKQPGMQQQGTASAAPQQISSPQAVWTPPQIYVIYEYRADSGGILEKWYAADKEQALAFARAHAANWAGQPEHARIKVEKKMLADYVAADPDMAYGTGNATPKHERALYREASSSGPWTRSSMRRWMAGAERASLWRPARR